MNTKESNSTICSTNLERESFVKERYDVLMQTSKTHVVRGINRSIIHRHIPYYRPRLERSKSDRASIRIREYDNIIADVLCSLEYTDVRFRMLNEEIEKKIKTNQALIKRIEALEANLRVLKSNIKSA